MKKTMIAPERITMKAIIIIYFISSTYLIIENHFSFFDALVSII
jgi:hypothetical protein